MSRRNLFGKFVLRLAAIALLVPLAGFGWAGYLQATGNFHEVEPALVFRSAQPAGEAFDRLLAAHHISTVLNLRGAAPDAGWYRDEQASIARAGARLVDIPLDADTPPTGEQMAQLVAALRAARTPLLIHCKAGSDRSGLAAALYELAVAGKSPAAAAAQLSFAYGHFPWLGSPTAAMDSAYWAYAAHLTDDTRVAVAAASTTPGDD